MYATMHRTVTPHHTTGKGGVQHNIKVHQIQILHNEEAPTGGK